MDMTSPSWNSTMDYIDENHSIYDTEGPVFLCDHDYLVHSSQVTAACYTVIFLLSVGGNLLVLFVLIKFETLKRVINLFILNLAVSDLVFAITLPFWITYHFSEWVFGDALCKIISGLYFVGLYSTLMFLVAITIDRYTIIVRKQQDALRKRLTYARVICGLIWVGSFCASLKEMVISRTLVDEHLFNTCESQEDRDEVGNYLHISFLFLLPLMIIIFCYSLILKTVMLSQNKKKHKTFAFIFCIVVVFFVCWAPYNVIILLMPDSENPECSRKRRLYLAFIFFRILAYSHCCVNPMLYAFTYRFRGHLYSIFCNSPRQRGTCSSKSNGHHSASNIFGKVAVNNETTFISLSTTKH